MSVWHAVIRSLGRTALVSGVAQGRMGDGRVLYIGPRACCMCRTVVRELLILYALEVYMLTYHT
jgi:hypothetical protein